MKNNFRALNPLPVLIVLISIFCVSCETTDDNNYALAQQCLDNAQTPSQATQCQTYVSGKTDARASRIRCGVVFIQRGFNTEKFKTIYGRLKQAGNENPATYMMTSLNISGNNSITGATADTDSQLMVSECNASKSPGLTMMAGYVRVAYVTSTLAGVTVDGSGNLDMTTVKSALNNLSSNPTQAAAIGEASVTIYNSYCTGSAKDSDLCKSIAPAVTAGGSNQEIGIAVGNYLKQKI